MQVIGVDTGGTFTDTVVTSEHGAIALGKALSTPGAVELGVLDSLRAAADDAGLTLDELLSRTDVLAHGTTVGLNALLTRAGARVGVITTAGFESTLAIAKANKILGLDERDLRTPVRWDKPVSLVPRRLVRGVRGRIDRNGNVVEPLVEDDVAEAVELLRRQGVESVAVCLLWSVANPAHERRVAELVRELAPGLRVAVSSDVAPRLGEYERMSTTVLDAYIGPVMSEYLDRLEQRLHEHGFRGSFLVMRMDGAVQPATLVRRAPVAALQSGPVAGVAAARMLGARLGHRDIITADVGGTSFDVGLIVDGEVRHLPRPMVDRLPLALPVVDVTSIGTGGGSIVWLDERLGALRVGPDSAGADPGPVCYGRGGTRPTVTDAAAVLGYVTRLSGELQLDTDAARRALHDTIAAPLGLTVERAAEGVLAVACEQMNDLIRRMTVQRGHDPRRFALYAFGGAGPQYVGRFADGLGVAAVVVPALASELSAHGAAATELRITVARDLPPAPLVERVDVVDALLRELEDAARAQMGEAFTPGEGAARLVVRASLGLRYVRQLNLIDVPLARCGVASGDVPALVSEFRERYERLVGEGTSNADTPIEVVRVSVAIASPAPDVVPSVPRREQAAVESRRAWFSGRELDCPVHRWTALAPGSRIDGPAFVESDQTTVVVYEGLTAVVDELGNINLQRQGADA
ncbi:MAG TPA: hydantoinase/oxoprolinase family protein [Acidimicrobiales bacterium]